MPKISVVVPVYNVEAYLKRCVDSILSQSLHDLELILVDDGSPDSCGAICDVYAEKDNRVHVIHQKNGGLSAARNAGIDYVIENSISEWITFVDSDDWIHPEMLNVLLKTAIKHQTKVSICGYAETTGETPEVQVDYVESTEWKPEDYYVAHNVNAVIACGKLYHRDCFANIRYPVGRIHEDEFTSHQILFSLDKIGVIEIPLYFYFQNCQSITQSSWNPKKLDCVDAVKAQLAFFEENGFPKALEATSVGYVYLLCRQKKCIKGSDLPLEEKKKFLGMVNRELRKSICSYWRFYCCRRNLDVFCVLFPVLVPVFEIAHKMRLFLGNGKIEE